LIQNLFRSIYTKAGIEYKDEMGKNDFIKNTISVTQKGTHMQEYLPILESLKCEKTKLTHINILYYTQMKL